MEHSDLRDVDMVQSVQNDFSKLSDDVLLIIFSYIAQEFSYPLCSNTVSSKTRPGFIWYRKTIPLVCKKWCSIHALPSELWSSVFVDVEKEILPQRKPRQDSHGAIQPSPQDSIRRSIGVRVNPDRVLQWLRPRCSKIKHLYLNFDNTNHDFSARDFEKLVSTVKSSLLFLHLVNNAGSEHDNLSCISVLRCMTDLVVESVPPAFLATCMPYFMSLTALTSLKFGPEKMPLVPGFTKTMPFPPSLRRLQLSDLMFETEHLANDFPPSLTSVSFAYCKFREHAFPVLLSKPKLAELMFRSCEFMAPSLFVVENGLTAPSPSTSLRVLALTNCNVQTLSMVGLEGLTKLDLSCNPDLRSDWGSGALGALPTSLTNLTALAELYLPSCNLATFPPPVLALLSLKVLNLESNCLITLPRELPAFAPTLTQLRLASNRLAGSGLSGGLPRLVLHCTELQSLSISAALVACVTDLAALPDMLPRLTELEVCGKSFEPRAVESLLKLKGRVASGGAGRQMEIRIRDS